MQLGMHSEPRDLPTSASLADWGPHSYRETLTNNYFPQPALQRFLSKAGLKSKCIFLLLVLLKRVSFIMKYNKLCLQDSKRPKLNPLSTPVPLKISSPPSSCYTTFTPS